MGERLDKAEGAYMTGELRVEIQVRTLKTGRCNKHLFNYKA